MAARSTRRVPSSCAGALVTAISRTLSAVRASPSDAAARKPSASSSTFGESDASPRSTSASARRATQDDRRQAVRLDGPAQRAALAEHLILSEQLVEGLGPDAVGQRRVLA